MARIGTGDECHDNGTPDDHRQIAGFPGDGICHQVVPKGSPPVLTGGPSACTYDVDHSDEFVLLDSRHSERFVATGMVS
jgi:hypothetical protein